MLLGELMCEEEPCVSCEAMRVCRAFSNNTFPSIHGDLCLILWKHQKESMRHFLKKGKESARTLIWSQSYFVSSLKCPCYVLVDTTYRKQAIFDYSLRCVLILRKLENKLVRNAGEKGLLQTSVIIPDVSEHWSLQRVNCAENLG